MDLEAFKKYAIPEYEADEMTRVIRKTIKSIRNKRQDAEEKQKDIITIKNKIQKEIEKEEALLALPPPTPPLIALPASEQAALPSTIPSTLPSPLIALPPTPVAIPGPSKKNDVIDINFDNDLSTNDIDNLRKENQKPPSELYNEFRNEFLENPKIIKGKIVEEIAKSQYISSSLRGKKSNANNAARKAEIDEELKTQRIYRDSLDKIINTSDFITKPSTSQAKKK